MLETYQYIGYFSTNVWVCLQPCRLPALSLVTPLRSLLQPVHRAEFTPFALSWTQSNDTGNEDDLLITETYTTLQILTTFLQTNNLNQTVFNKVF